MMSGFSSSVWEGCLCVWVVTAAVACGSRLRLIALIEEVAYLSESSDISVYRPGTLRRIPPATAATPGNSPPGWQQRRRRADLPARNAKHFNDGHAWLQAVTCGKFF